MELIKFYTKGKSKKDEIVNLKYSPLSNYYIPKRGILIDGKLWKTTEHYFQAMKFRGPGVGNRKLAEKYIEIIRTDMNTPNRAFILGKIGKILNKDGTLRKFNNYNFRNKELVDMLNQTFLGKINVRTDWEDVKIEIMIRGNIHKFRDNIKLKNLITHVPDNTYFVEHTSRDKIWADGGDGGSGELGKNYLGKILTALSYILKHGSCKGISANIKRVIRIKNKK